MEKTASAAWPQSLFTERRPPIEPQASSLKPRAAPGSS
jgi:hypothetical protein